MAAQQFLGNSQLEAHLKANMPPAAVAAGLTPTQWAQLIQEILAILASLNNPTPAAVAAGLSPMQWIALIQEILAILAQLNPPKPAPTP